VLPGVPIFLCNWHVRKAWVKNLLLKVKASSGRTEQEAGELRCKMYTRLLAIQEMHAADHAALDKAVTQAVAKFRVDFDSEAHEFCVYFEKEWGKRDMLRMNPPSFFLLACWLIGAPLRGCTRPGAMDETRRLHSAGTSSVVFRAYPVGATSWLVATRVQHTFCLWPQLSPECAADAGCRLAAQDDHACTLRRGMPSVLAATWTIKISLNAVTCDWQWHAPI